MKAKSYIQYKTKDGQIKLETLWIQRLDPNRVTDGKLILMLSTEEDGSPRITENDKGEKQYSFNELVKEGAFTFLTMEQVNIVKAMKLGRNIGGEICIELPIHYSIPSSIFNQAPVWE